MRVYVLGVDGLGLGGYGGLGLGRLVQSMVQG